VFEAILKALVPLEQINLYDQTPRLAAQAFGRLTAGYAHSSSQILKTERFPVHDYRGLVEIPDINFISLCEHTLLPFFGVVSIDYEPGEFLAGAGVFEEIVKVQTRRLTLQEPLTQKIAEILLHGLIASRVQVKIEARHTCMDGRMLRTQVELRNQP
jgi:GTP cyclohydrolase I